MKIVTSEFTKTIEDLISNLRREDFSDVEEYELAQKYNALPLGFDFIAYGFITPNGEVIWHDVQDDFDKSNDPQALINALVWGKNRYPQLKDFIPIRSDESKTCPVCEGTGIWKSSKNILTGEPGKCVVCAALGWVTDECYEKMQSQTAN